MPNEMLIVWSSKWETGIDIIDEQHRGIASLINTLYYHMRHNMETEHLTKVIYTLKYYMELHALTEEILLLKSKYPKTGEHAQSHERLLRELESSIREYSAVSYPKLSAPTFMELFKKWWLTHIGEEDREFVPHVMKFLNEAEDTKRRNNRPSF